MPADIADMLPDELADLGIVREPAAHVSDPTPAPRRRLLLGAGSEHLPKRGER